MSTFAVVVLIIVVVLIVVAIMVFLRRLRRHDSAARHRTGPRTVAELVELRGVEGRDLPVAVVPEVAPEQVADPVAEPDSTPRPTAPAIEADAVEKPRTSTTTGADTPWARGARMTGEPDGPGEPWADTEQQPPPASRGSWVPGVAAAGVAGVAGLAAVAAHRRGAEDDAEQPTPQESAEESTGSAAVAADGPDAAAGQSTDAPAEGAAAAEEGLNPAAESGADEPAAAGTGAGPATAAGKTSELEPGAEGEPDGWLPADDADAPVVEPPADAQAEISGFGRGAESPEAIPESAAGETTAGSSGWLPGAAVGAAGLAAVAAHQGSADESAESTADGSADPAQPVVAEGETGPPDRVDETADDAPIAAPAEEAAAAEAESDASSSGEGVGGLVDDPASATDGVPAAETMDGSSPVDEGLSDAADSEAAGAASGADGAGGAVEDTVIATAEVPAAGGASAITDGSSPVEVGVSDAAGSEVAASAGGVVEQADDVGGAVETPVATTAEPAEATDSAVGDGPPAVDGFDAVESEDEGTAPGDAVDGTVDHTAPPVDADDRGADVRPEVEGVATVEEPAPTPDQAEGDSGSAVEGAGVSAAGAAERGDGSTGWIAAATVGAVGAAGLAAAVVHRGGSVPADPTTGGETDDGAGGAGSAAGQPAAEAEQELVADHSADGADDESPGDNMDDDADVEGRTVEEAGLAAAVAGRPAAPAVDPAEDDPTVSGEEWAAESVVDEAADDPDYEADDDAAAVGPTGADLAAVHAETAAEQDRRPRRTPAERAAEHAAVDVALLRTFGVAETGDRPGAAPIVSLSAAAPHPTPREPVGPPTPVRVTVLGRDDAPVEGAAAALVDDRGTHVDSAETAVDGRVELTAPGSGTYMVVVSARQHQPGAVAVTVAGGPAEVTLPLVRSSSVAGSVWAADEAIADAQVSLLQDGELVEETESGGDGGFRIPDLTAGAYALSVTASGFEQLVVPLEVPPATDVRHDLDLQPSALVGTSPQVQSAD